MTIQQIHTNTINPITLTDWRVKLWEIHREEIAHIPPSEVYLRLSEAGGKIAENVRRARYYPTIDGIALCLIALLDLYNRVVNDPAIVSSSFPELEDYIFYKFPRRCWSCGSEHCSCFIKYADPEHRTSEERKREAVDIELERARFEEEPPHNLDSLGELFRGIYGQGHRYMDFSEIGFHLLEEIGEVAEALRNLFNGDSETINGKLQEAFCSEIGDVISWLFALRQKATYHIRQASMNYKAAPNIPLISEDLEKICL